MSFSLVYDLIIVHSDDEAVSYHQEFECVPFALGWNENCVTKIMKGGERNEG